MAVEISFLGLDCHDCKKNPDLQKHRGCINPTEKVQYIIDGKQIYRCPARYIKPEIQEYIQMYSYYKKGFLPFRGSLSEQPSKLLDIFDIIESAEIKRQKNKFKDI